MSSSNRPTVLPREPGPEPTREDIFAEERLTLGGVGDIVMTACVNGKYMDGEEYYLHMAKRAKQLHEATEKEKS